MKCLNWVRGASILSAILLMNTGSADAEDIIYFAPHTGEIEIFDGDNPPDRFRQPESPTKHVKGGTISWNVTYNDVVQNTDFGFDDPTHGATRQATVEAVLTYISSILNETSGATIDVRFGVSQMDGTGFLAQAGTFYFQGTGFSRGFAFDHITTGVDPTGMEVDITSTFDFGYNYLNDHTQMPVGGQNDLFSVLLHEMTHGLGIASLSDDNGNSRVSPFGNPGRYTYWDRLMRFNGDAVFNVSSTSFEVGISPATFNSDALSFGGPAAAGQHGAAAPIFAPTTFASGSSLSHFKTNAVNSVMEHVIFTGVAERAYSNVDLGALFDIGYANVVTTPTAYFETNKVAVSENAGTATINLLVTVDPGVTETVTIATANGTAEAGVDYTNVNQSFDVGPGTTPVPVAIDIDDNLVADGSRTFTLAVSNPSAGLLMGTPSTVTVTIVDNDTPNENAVVTGVSGVGFIEEGATLNLSVAVSGLVDPVAYQWKIAGADVVDGGRFSGATTSTLTIDPVQLGDTNIYELTGNDASKGTFSSGPLSVQVVAAGSLPAAGMAALGLLTGMFATAGVVIMRRRRN